jgi:hypothetical protein
MTYTTGSGVPIPQGTDAFNPPAQFKDWGDKAATYENHVVVALDSERLALVAPVLRDGLRCYVSGTGIEWLYLGGWGRFLPKQPHIEFTATTSVPSGSSWGVGTVTLDSAASTDTGLATSAANGVTLASAGIYAISLSGDLTAAATGRSFAGIQIGSRVYALSSIAPGENLFVASVPNLRATTAGVVVLGTLFQTTGATRTVNTRITVTKIGA